MTLAMRSSVGLSAPCTVSFIRSARRDASSGSTLKKSGMDPGPGPPGVARMNGMPSPREEFPAASVAALLELEVDVFWAGGAEGRGVFFAGLESKKPLHKRPWDASENLP